MGRFLFDLRAGTLEANPGAALSNTVRRLLDDVRELVCQKAVSIGRTRTVLTTTKDDVGAEVEGLCVDCLLYTSPSPRDS